MFWTLKAQHFQPVFFFSKKGEKNYPLPEGMKNAYKVLPRPYVTKYI